MPKSTTQEERWASEASYFDAEEYSDAPLDAKSIERYIRCEKPWLLAEYPYHLLGDVRGKRVLEIGCGDGAQSIVLASKGAKVTGVDLSGRAIEVARRRAEAHGLASRIDFIQSPLELYRPDAPFDFVMGFAILHHMLPVLEETLVDLRRFGRPSARYIFVEPVNMWQLLRKVRLMLPIQVPGTVDERPLEPRDLEIVRRVFPSVDVAYFDALLRFGQYLLPNHNYELASGVRRKLYESIALADRALLQTMGMRWLASSAVISAGQSTG